MKHILVIEISATLRMGISKYLQDDFILHHAVNYREGLERLAADGNANIPRYDVVILHWPAMAAPTTDELLALLQEPDYAHVAVLVLAHESSSSNMDWVSARGGNTAMLHWENYRDIKDAIDTLVLTGVPKVQEVPVPVTGDTGPLSVIVVDDSPTVRTKFRRLLAKQGYEVEAASNAQEALDLIAEHPVDIAVIDYFMPNGNGDWLVQQIKANPQTAHITCAILTGTYHDEVITASLEAGAVECMFKNEANSLFLARVAAMERAVRITRGIDREREQLDNILESVGDGVYGIDLTGKITFINPSAKRILGYPDSFDPRGWRPQELFQRTCVGPNGDKNEKSDCILNKAYTNQETLSAVDTVFTRHNGSTIQVELTVRPMSVDGDICGMVIAFRDVSMRKLLEDELKWQASHDPLTKLYNRKYFEEAMMGELDKCRKHSTVSALLYIDLDRFKYINDTLGHNAGDRLLIEIGALLDNKIRKRDLLARLGGDEFAVILRNLDARHTHKIAEDLRQTLANYMFMHNGRAYQINGSIGIALIDAMTKSAGDILANADVACHIAKGKGRNQTHLYQDEEDRKVAMDMELGWSAKLSKAIRDNQFTLHFQPIVPLADINPATMSSEVKPFIERYLNRENLNSIMFEVLIRLADARGRHVSPNAFIPTAERFNMMPQIDEWVVAHAMETLGELNKRNLQTVITLNLSGQSLSDIKLAKFICSEAERNGVDPKQLVFEITETCAVSNIDTARNFIQHVSDFGSAFALDDFGSGYCSFPHLKNLPVDYVKIDGYYVQGIAHDRTDMAIVSSINNIAHSLGKKTIAESVENIQSLQKLHESGIDYVQGRYIAEPEEINDLLASIA